MSTTEQKLRDRLEQLEELVGVNRSLTSRIRSTLDVEPDHAEILGMLLRREFVTRDGLYTVLYEDRPECDWPQEKILDVQMCKLRVALKMLKLDIEIKTRWGEGWSISRTDKAKLRARIETRSAADAESRRLAFLDGH